jgi:hypothetical protein
MAIIGNLPVILQNGTVADANQVMSDFNFIVNQVNANAAPLTQFITGGQLLAVQVFTVSGTYTPTLGTSRAYIKVLGGGGAGGGAAATTAGQFAVGGGGGAGGYAEGLIISPTSGAILIGTGGVGVAGAAGGNGSPTGFQGIVVANGGLGGLASTATTSPNALGGSGGSVGTPGSILNLQGANGGSAFGYVTGVIGMTGFGANSMYGGGGINQTNANVSGTNATLFGAGGSGAFNGASQAARAGGQGSAGVLIVFDYQ